MCTRFRFLILVMLLLSQPLAAFAAKCTAHPAGDSATTAEHCAQGSSNDSNSSDETDGHNTHKPGKDSGRQNHDECSFDCESCGAVGFLAACERLAFDTPPLPVYEVLPSSRITNGFSNPLFRPPIRS
jgi:hypothetical protein